MSERFTAPDLDDTETLTPEYKNVVRQMSELSIKRFHDFNAEALLRLKGNNNEETE